MKNSQTPHSGSRTPRTPSAAEALSRRVLSAPPPGTVHGLRSQGSFRANVVQAPKLHHPLHTPRREAASGTQRGRRAHAEGAAGRRAPALSGREGPGRPVSGEGTAHLQQPRLFHLCLVWPLPSPPPSSGVSGWVADPCCLQPLAASFPAWSTGDCRAARKNASDTWTSWPHGPAGSRRLHHFLALDWHRAAPSPSC